MKDIYALQIRIEQGSAAILTAQREGGKDITGWVQHILELEKRLFELFDTIPGMKLSEFEKLNYSIEVYSSQLNQCVWFCPDQEAADQIRREDTDAVTYTPAELRHLITLNPGPESLKAINEGKKVLSGAIIETTPIREVKIELP